VGEWLVAIGNPFGLGGTVTAGILSARARDINAGPYDSFLQTDAAINAGNSGGPLFNADGEVIGVNTAIFSPSGGNIGIGFAVPSDLARSVIDDLEAEGRVQRGYLGVRVQSVDEDLAAALGIEPGVSGAPGGALVSEVTDASPAAEAGLEPGDVVVEIAGTAVEDARDLTFAVAELPAGEAVPVAVLREGERRTLDVTIGEQPDALYGAGPPDREGGPGEPRLGVSVAALDEEAREQAGIPDEVTGLLVASVQPGTPAARADLRQGDVISAAGGEEITEVAALRQAAADAEEGDRPLLLRIWRQGSYAFVPVRLTAATEG
jgi:serine protease Do